MGYVTALSPCGNCGRPFTYNPKLVPSFHGVPFCGRCIEDANPIRIGKGLPEIKPHPDAYSACDEREL